jgi:phospholipase D1/2
LLNGSRKLLLKFQNDFERELLIDEISRKVIKYQYSIRNIYNSFANEKDSCNATWLVDGASYFEHLFETLQTAEETIYIAGWWVSPELWLKRPVDVYNSDKYRLQDLLLKKAESGVKICILVYREIPLVLKTASYHAKEYMNSLHPNIIVKILLIIYR